MKKLFTKKFASFFLILTLAFSLFSVLTITGYAADYSSDTSGVTGGDTISGAGTYTLANNASGTITVTTDADVTIAGYSAATAYSGLSIVCSNTSGTNLTIENLYISSPNIGDTYTDSAGGTGRSNVIRFAASSNTLTLSGTSILEAATGGAVIHVDPNQSLTIGGSGALYIYKTGAWTCIGGNGGEGNGDITIDSGNIFAKGSKMGALIGSGSYCSATPGDITINGGVINLEANARGAAIGVGAGDSGGSGTFPSSTGDVYINGGTVNINVDYTGAAIGNAGTNAPDQLGIDGSLIVTGGSIRTFIDENAFSIWSKSSRGVYTDAVTSTAEDAGGNSLYMAAIDTSGISGPDYTVYVDGKPYYEGGKHDYYYVNEMYVQGSQTRISYTPDNWQSSAGTAYEDDNLYFYLTGEDHLICVNGIYYTAAYSSGGFTVSPAAAYTVGSGGTYSTLTSALNAMGGNAGVISVVGTTAISGDETVALSDKQAIARGSGVTGSLFTITSGAALTLNSLFVYDGTGTFITVNGGTFTVSPTSGGVFKLGETVYLASGQSISVGAALSGITGYLIVQCANESSGTLIAGCSSMLIAVRSASKFTYYNNIHTLTRSGATIIIA